MQSMREDHLQNSNQKLPDSNASGESPQEDIPASALIDDETAVDPSDVVTSKSKMEWQWTNLTVADHSKSKDRVAAPPKKIVSRTPVPIGVASNVKMVEGLFTPDEIKIISDEIDKWNDSCVIDFAKHLLRYLPNKTEESIRNRLRKYLNPLTASNIKSESDLIEKLQIKFKDRMTCRKWTDQEINTLSVLLSSWRENKDNEGANYNSFAEFVLNTGKLPGRVIRAIATFIKNLMSNDTIPTEISGNQIYTPEQISKINLKKQLLARFSFKKRVHESTVSAASSALEISDLSDDETAVDRSAVHKQHRQRWKLSEIKIISDQVDQWSETNPSIAAFAKQLTLFLPKRTTKSIVHQITKLLDPLTSTGKESLDEKKLRGKLHEKFKDSQILRWTEEEVSILSELLSSWSEDKSHSGVDYVSFAETVKLQGRTTKSIQQFIESIMCSKNIPAEIKDDQIYTAIQRSRITLKKQLLARFPIKHKKRTIDAEASSDDNFSVDDNSSPEIPAHFSANAKKPGARSGGLVERLHTNVIDKLHNNERSPATASVSSTSGTPESVSTVMPAAAEPPAPQLPLPSIAQVSDVLLFKPPRGIPRRSAAAKTSTTLSAASVASIAKPNT